MNETRTVHWIAFIVFMALVVALAVYGITDDRDRCVGGSPFRDNQGCIEYYQGR